MRGSPLPLMIAPGTVEPARCVASGAGRHHARAGEPATFSVQLRDGCDNPVRSVAGHALKLTLTPRRPAQLVSAEPGAEGEFVVSYTVPISGRFQLAVTLGEGRLPIRGSRRW